MTTPKRLTIPDGPETFSDDDFAVSSQRTRALIDKILENPQAKSLVEKKLERIHRRVQSLAALRKARGLTQVQLSEELGLSQGEISRLERRDNLHLATLSRFIEATGGRLRIVAVYNDQEVEVSLGELAEASP